MVDGSMWLLLGLWLGATLWLALYLHHLQQRRTQEQAVWSKQQDLYLLQQKEQLAQQQLAQQELFVRMQTEQTKQLQQYFISQMSDFRGQFTGSLQNCTRELDERLSIFTNNTDQSLGRMDKRLSNSLGEQLANTREIFSSLMQRLALVDEAQKQMHQLSDRVLNLQQLLSDKRSRGALGEMQLEWILHNAMPARNYALQYTLSNQCRVDSILILPPPVGLLAIDAKFPLDNYKKMADERLATGERKAAEKAFVLDIKRHINDVADKYIVAGETADSAMLFVPSEAVFAEIHNNHVELVELAYQRKVWLVSPTTLMAVLTTAGMVVKDLAMQEQLLEVQQHLKVLGEEFMRFEQRSEAYARHLQQTVRDWEQLKITTHKLIGCFQRISTLELNDNKQ